MLPFDAMEGATGPLSNLQGAGEKATGLGGEMIYQPVSDGRV